MIEISNPMEKEENLALTFQMEKASKEKYQEEIITMLLS